MKKKTKKKTKSKSKSNNIILEQQTKQEQPQTKERIRKVVVSKEQLNEYLKKQRIRTLFGLIKDRG